MDHPPIVRDPCLAGRLRQTEFDAPQSRGAQLLRCEFEETFMPKIDVAAVSLRKGSGYPAPFDSPCAGRSRQRLGNAGGLSDFGVN